MKYLNKTTKLCAIFAATLVTLFSACTKNYSDYNKNPNALTNDDLLRDNIGASAFIPTMQVNVFYNLLNQNYIYQIQQNLNADAFSGYASPVGFTGNYNANYALNTGWNLWPFKVGYSGIMANWKAITGRAANLPQVLAVATILKVEGMHRVTDVYGPIPYTKFGTSALSTPYDDQQAVYNALFKDLDDAIKSLTDFVAKNPNDGSLTKFDLVYNGDLKQWIKFANSLKLRLAIRISFANPSLAKTKADEVATVMVDGKMALLTDNTDNALVTGGKGVTTSNGLYVCDVAYKNSRMNASIESILKGYKDDRITKYFQPPAAAALPTDRAGVRNGTLGDFVAVASSVNLKESSPVQYMCAAEVSFLRAEAALRGWTNVAAGMTAQQLYEQGIRLSFAQYNAANVDAYINDNTSTQAPYVNPLGNSDGNVPAGSPLLSTTTIKWDDGASNAVKMERIITQKWIAIFPDGQEAWTEFRRTGYPKLFPVTVNNSGGTINTAIQIRRLPFSDDEYKTNNAEVQKAISLLGGPDNGGTRLWWDIANKNF